MLFSPVLSRMCVFVAASLALPAPNTGVFEGLSPRNAITGAASRHVNRLEKRQDTYTITGMAAAAQVDVKGIVLNDPLTEGTWTQDLIGKLYDYYPTKNMIVYHNAESYKAFSDDAVHVHYELPIFASTYGYEIYVFDTGSFELAGDGGFANWCYDGDYSGPDANGLVTFYART